MQRSAGARRLLGTLDGSMRSALRILKTQWWVLIAAVGLVLYGLAFPSSWQFLISGVVVYVLLVIVGSCLRARDERQKQSENCKAYLAEIGSLHISDTELLYTRKGESHSVRWDHVSSIAYFESPYGAFGEDEWVIRAAKPYLSVPDYPELSQPFLHACAQRLPGFDIDCLSRARLAHSPADREPTTIECWRREEPSNPSMQTDRPQAAGG